MNNKKVETLKKSNLRIDVIITITIIIAVMMIITMKLQTKEVAETETPEEETQLAYTTVDRSTAVTSRYQVSRENVDVTLGDVEKAEIVPPVTYLSIDEIEISKNMDLTQRCGVSKADFKTLLENTRADSTNFFADNSDIIYDLCEEYELNEIFFCGLIAGESGWNIASNHRSKHNYISMMSKGSLIYYDSVESGLRAAAKLLHNSYLTPGGSFYSGKTLSNIQKRFCPNSTTWVNLIYSCMSQIV